MDFSLLLILLLRLLTAAPTWSLPLDLEEKYNEVLASADSSLHKPVSRDDLIMAKNMGVSLPTSFFAGMLNPHLYWMQDVYCDSVRKRLAFVTHSKGGRHRGDEYHLSSWMPVQLLTGETRELEVQVGYNAEDGCKVSYVDVPFFNPLALLPEATFVSQEHVDGRVLDRWRQRSESPSDVWFDHETRRPVRVRNIVGRSGSARHRELEYVDFNVWAFEARDWGNGTSSSSGSSSSSSSSASGDEVFNPKPEWNCRTPPAPRLEDIARPPPRIAR